MAVTIRDVAQAARVSPATVSRTLTTPGLVNSLTQVRVREAIERLGYRPNRAARGLITGRTGNLGLIVPDLSNPFFSSIAKSVQARARRADYAVFIADTDEDPRAEDELVHAIAKQVDGIILCAPRALEDQIDRLANSSPVVLMHRQAGRHLSVVADHADGMRQLVEHLVALGHRRLAYVDGPRDSWTGAERRRGLSTATAEAGVELVELGHYFPQFEGGAAAADILIASGASAVIAYNDILALGLLNRLSARGIAVPEHMSVVGIDNTAVSAMSNPPLTTLSIPKEEGGRAAVDLLLSLIGDPGSAPATHVVLPTHLIVRGSSTVAPAMAPDKR